MVGGIILSSCVAYIFSNHYILYYLIIKTKYAKICLKLKT